MSEQLASKMIVLKPCPFCGLDMNLAYPDRHGAVWEKIAKTWNSRPIEDALRQQVRTLREALESIRREVSDIPAKELTRCERNIFRKATAALRNQTEVPHE